MWKNHLSVGVIILTFLVAVKSGKILANFPSVEMADFRFGLGDPYVIFYQKENYRGKVHFQRIAKKGCSNLEGPFQNWASSVDLQRRCVKLCDGVDCSGNCKRVDHDLTPMSERGVAYLEKYGMNDKVKSLKYCYL